MHWIWGYTQPSSTKKVVGPLTLKSPLPLLSPKGSGVADISREREDSVLGHLFWDSGSGGLCEGWIMEVS